MSDPLPSISWTPPAGDPDASLRREWFLTNGLGGFASGTPLAIPQRRYHAWLIGALKPPVGRVAALLSMVESVVLKAAAGTPTGQGEQRLEFSTFEFPGAETMREGEAPNVQRCFSPPGREFLQRFEKDVACRWMYRCGPVEFTRELILPHGRNTAVLRYTATSARHAARLELRPLTPLRDFHELVRESQRKGDYSVISGPGTCEVSTPVATLSLSSSAGSFTQDRQWWFNFRYPRDAERGQDSTEDIFSPGWFALDLVPGKAAVLEICASVFAPGDRASRRMSPVAFDSAAAEERERVSRLMSQTPSPASVGLADGPSILRTLVAAADQFVVERARPALAVGPPRPPAAPDCSVIAGYPWFSDWGRDTMISLPGLLLVTRRLDEAKRVLETFAGLTRRGLVPNCFDNGSGQAEYNTVDASLWFLHAARSLQLAFAKAGKPDPTDDKSPIRRACLSIIEAYQEGTDFNIRMDPRDSLISAGDIGTQLTWMDAKRDGVVFTPRHGKPVEINALWFSGLQLVADMIDADRPNSARQFRQIAQRAGQSLRESFWNAGAGCLYDVLTPGPGGWTPNSQIRPNQIFACSLPYSALDQQQAESVLRVVTQKLLTPRGLRTLSPDDPHYVGRFEGPLFRRDGAYHNGTVWPWLIGPYAEATLRIGKFSNRAKADAVSALRPLLEMIAPGEGGGPGLGQIPEIYDGDDSAEKPRRPDGCFAQAWSVAECLRVWLLANS